MLVYSCGSQKGVGEPEVSRGPVENAFYAASAESGVPVRMLIAAAYLESGVRPKAQSAAYLQGSTQVDSAISFGETAFGLGVRELGLANDPSAATDLKLQISAYGKYLRSRLQGADLPSGAVTPEEKHRWLWQLAQIHRGQDQNRNLWSVFTKEMMGVMNDGFEAVEVSKDEVLTLEKESSPLDESNLPGNYQQDLNFYSYTGDIRPAYLFSLYPSRHPDIKNKPKRVEVIHCPLSLSACLNIQANFDPTYTRLGAHYVIPNNTKTSPGILQLARHDEPVELTAADGSTEIVQDRIIVMLAGYSGRYMQGVRAYANPTWLNNYQLSLLSTAVNDICAALERGPDQVPRQQCLSPAVDGGLSFRSQNGLYRWGDVADFDSTIFYPYIKEISGITANTTMDTTDGRSIIDAASSFSLRVQFQSSARRVELERLIRCAGPDQRVVWESVESKPVRNLTSKDIELNWFDAGPNGNGDQFFRAKVTGDAGKFLGWAMKYIQIKNYSKDTAAEVTSSACQVR
jgi:hypothetical protein